jgi:CheY-like chemotaxis protein
MQLIPRQVHLRRLDAREVLSRRMAKRNVEVAAAFSGSQAIQVLRRGDFDVAILNLKKEDMVGIEVLKIFKKMDERMSGDYAHRPRLQTGRPRWDRLRRL